jgi:hypothetical protein
MSEEKYVSLAKKADNGGSENPKIKDICRQLREVRELIAEDLATAAEENDMKAFIELLDLDLRAKEVMRNIGCGGTAIVSAMMEMVENLALQAKEE